jgi:hypothetical protein
MNTITINHFCHLCKREETFSILEEYKDCERCTSSAHGPTHDACRPHGRIHCSADICF